MSVGFCELLFLCVLDFLSLFVGGLFVCLKKDNKLLMYKICLVSFSKILFRLAYNAQEVYRGPESQCRSENMV